MACFKANVFNLGVLTASAAVVLTVVLLSRVFVNSKRSRRRRKCRTKQEKAVDFINVDEQMLARFCEAIQCKTVSWSMDKLSTEELLKYHDVIKRAFPTVHSSPWVKCEIVNQYSLLFTITGSEPSLKPYMLISHLDVVPVTDQKWDVDPFEGLVKDGYIWGRGTLDVKNGVMGALEALEYLLNTGFQPKRGFFLAFGHDEEVFGFQGAFEIAKELKSRGVHELEFIQDEGLMILDGVVPGMTKCVASIGVAEKGNFKVELLVETSPCHGSIPPKETSVGILAKAVASIESNPMPSTFGCGPEEEMLTCIAYEMPLLMRIIISNMWLFRPILTRFLSRKAAMNAIVRTTIAVTKISGGTKDNVIPSSASATLDIRIHPGDTPKTIINHLRSCIKDERVQINVKAQRDVTPIASSDEHSFGYNSIASSILDVFPDVVVTPGLLIGGTDSKHFLDMTANVYRFMPSVLSNDGIAMIHGINERISITNYEQTINFYHRLMLNADNSSL